jgi:hypothetical protein
MSSVMLALNVEMFIDMSRFESCQTEIPPKRSPSTTGNHREVFSMADDRPGGVDYSGFSFDEKMRVYYSARPYAFAWARAARLPSDPARPHAGKLFPYEPMHQWLSYGGSDRAADAFSKREFSFTLANDVYIRSAPRAVRCVCRAAWTEGSLPCVRCVVAAS